MSYNGWKNYETWNVVLWLNNEEYLYRLVVNYGKDRTYADFARSFLVPISAGTPDGVAWLSDSLDYDALDEALEEIG